MKSQRRMSVRSQLTARWRVAGRGRRAVAIIALLAVILAVCGGVAFTQFSGGASSGALTAHPSATHDTVMNLHDGAKLVIPAGAMTNNATVTASYVSSPAASQSGEKAIGTPLQISIQPANAIQQPIQLEWPLPKSANPLAARFGAYLLGTYDASSRQWTGVETAYDPSKQVLTAQITGSSASGQAWKTTGDGNSPLVAQDAYTMPSSAGSLLRSLWSPVQEVTDAALSFFTCVGFSPKVIIIAKFIKCVAGDLAKSNAKDVVGKLITAVLPQSCVGKLIVDQALNFSRTLGVELVVGPVTLLFDIAREPACQGSHTLPQPTVTALLPTSGPTKGGAAVSISGTLLYLVDQVTFGGVSAHFKLDYNKPDFKHALPTGFIVATAPAHAAGMVDVRISIGGGSSPISAADQYTYR